MRESLGVPAFLRHDHKTQKKEAAARDDCFLKKSFFFFAKKEERICVGYNQFLPSFLLLFNLSTSSPSLSGNWKDLTCEKS